MASRRTSASAVSAGISGAPSALALQVFADGSRGVSEVTFGFLRGVGPRSRARSRARFCAVLKLDHDAPSASSTAVPSIVGLPTMPFGSFTPCTPP